jgi:predicted nucleic acid-binding protein
MEWLRKLYGTVVGLDSAPLIYFVEAHPLYRPYLRPFFEAVERGDIQVVTSAITLTEVLIHPFRQANVSLTMEYSDILLHSPNLATRSVTSEIATLAAKIRAMHGLKTPDAIQLATAQEANATAFLTNDRGLSSLPEMKVFVLDDILAAKQT